MQKAYGWLAQTFSERLVFCFKKLKFNLLQILLAKRLTRSNDLEQTSVLRIQ
jgi:hypothetical protein